MISAMFYILISVHVKFPVVLESKEFHDNSQNLLRTYLSLRPFHTFLLIQSS
jgi:hypothetical protein